MIKKMVKALENNQIKVILVAISIVVLFALTVLSKSKYVSEVNSTISLNIRKPQYTVYFYPGTKLEGNAESQNFVYGTAQNLRANTFTKQGFAFDGWNTEEDGSGTSYSDEESVNNLSSTDGDTIDLFAQWEAAADFTVTYCFGDEEFEGTNYINTGLQLMHDDNLHRDFEISADLSDMQFLSGQTSNRNTILSCKWEDNSPYPGFALLHRDNASTLNIKLQINATATPNYQQPWGGGPNYKNSGHISLKRTNDKIYEDNIERWDMSTINKSNVPGGVITTPLSFGATLNGNLSTKMFMKGTLSNINVKLYYTGDEISFFYNNLPVPTRTGFTFLGWFTQPVGGTQITSQSTGNPGNITLYPHWRGQNYTVIFDANGGTGSMANQICESGADETLAANTYTKANYAFDGWNTRADGNGTNYADEGTINKQFRTSNQSVTLYAKWKLVTLKKQEGSEATSFFLDGAIRKNEIESITFTTSISGANNTKWDVSNAGNGSILAWYTDTDSDGLYEVIIGSNSGIVKANTDSQYLLAYIGSNANCDDTTCLYGIENLDISDVICIGAMFRSFGYTAMASLDLGNNFNTSNVIDMWDVFNQCGYKSMTSLNLGPYFYTSKATTMLKMFEDCGYTAMTALNLGANFDTSKVTNMQGMFCRCGHESMVTLNLGSNFDTSSVTNMYYMFEECGYNAMTALDLGSKFDTSKVTIMSSMFRMCGFSEMTSLNLGSNFDTSNVKNMQYMFHSCGKLKLPTLNLGQKFDTSKCENMTGMFYVCGKEKLTSLDLGTKFDTSNVTNMSQMFYGLGFKEMTTLNLGSNFDTSNVTDMYNMFSGCGSEKLTVLDLGNKFDTSKVTSMNAMFNDCGKKKMTTLNLGPYFNTSNVTEMNYMFAGCGELKMTALNLGSNFDTSKVTNMDHMFYFCGKELMTTLNLGTNFDTSNVTNMAYMFSNCGKNALTSLDLGTKFDTSKVTNMDNMFSNCGRNALTSLDLGTKFDTSKVTNMDNMFRDCGLRELTTLNLGDNFDTSNVTNMNQMFFWCGTNVLTNFSLGSKFNTSKVTNMTQMFSNFGKALTSLDLTVMTFDTTVLTDYTDIFLLSGKPGDCTVSFNQDYATFINANKSTSWSTLVPVAVPAP